MEQSTRVCSVEGCGKKRTLRGWCNPHYRRWLAHGDPLVTRRFLDPVEALAARTRVEGDCLVWTGALNEAGYGVLSIGGRMQRAHRFAWQQASGEIPDGLQIDHICHNKACVKVEHLRVATHSQNQQHLSGPRSHNRSGVRNVFWCKREKCWVVELTKDGQSRRYGYFDCLDEASVVAETARQELFGVFAGLG